MSNGGRLPDDLPRLPVITVTERRRRSGVAPFGMFIGPGVLDRLQDSGEAGQRGTGERAFAPPAVPGVIDEIVTTAKRTTVPRPGTIAARTGLAGIIGAGIGFIASEFLREVSQARLDEIGRLAVEPARERPDSPLVVQPEVIPEIRVVAKRPTFLETIRQRFALPPLPTFTPFRDLPDPFILQPIGPAPTLPAPEVIPDVAIPLPQPVPVPIRPPAIVPLPTPTMVPLPRTAPQTRPRPATRPSPSPLPIGAPTPTPAPATRPTVRPEPLTSVRPDLLPSVDPRSRPFAAPRPAGCPPCPPARRCKRKKDEEEPRTECFKKLVKEAFLPRDDETFNWVPIDCFSGKEL